MDRGSVANRMCGHGRCRDRPERSDVIGGPAGRGMMDDMVLFVLALVTFVVYALIFVEVAAGNRSIPFLRDFDPAPSAEDVSVSVVIAARNEEKKIGEALSSVLNQTYPRMEVIVVDDRSTDGTAAALGRMRSLHPKLRVERVDRLPEGWLGKNHALWAGARLAKGDILLFTDADVVFDPTAVARAVGAMRTRGLDHLALSLEIDMPSFFLRAFAGAFVMFFSLYALPWRAKNPKSKFHVGIGGFNMVRASAYRASGGHEAIRLRPDDDMKLGKIIKKNGFRQELLHGREMVRVEWYATLGETVRGLEKNAFAGVEYRIDAVVGATIVQLAMNVWPWAAIFLTGGWTAALNAAIVALLLALAWDSGRFVKTSPWAGLFFPITTILFLYIVWRSALLALWRGGIVWRGTAYSLKDLRVNRV